MKLFRSLRMNSMDTGKFKNYLKYAIGEIFLVVIGILIALQVDNWNDNRKERASERVHLLALQTEFKDNLSRLSVAKRRADSILSASQKIIAACNGDKTILTDSAFSRLIFKTFSSEPTYIPASGVLAEMISAGNLKVLRDNELKTYLAGWDSRIRRINSQEAEVLKFRFNATDHIRLSGSFKRIFDGGWSSDLNRRSNVPLLGNEVFENDMLLFYAAVAYLQSDFYDSCEKNINSILDTIEKDLN
jgi:hypothetical protein